MLKECYIRQDILKWHYRIVPEKCYHTDLGQYDTYGILLTGLNHEEMIHDVSVDEQTVIRMTELFNLRQLSPCHFMAAVEDMFANIY